MSSEIIHTLFVACDHLIVLAYFISGPAGSNVCHSSEVEPASGIAAPTFSVVSLLPAIHLSFLSLLWITGAAHWESCPNTFVLPKQSVAVPPLSLRLCVGEHSSGGTIVKSLEVQQDSLYSLPLGAFFLFFFFLGAA